MLKTLSITKTSKPKELPTKPLSNKNYKTKTTLLMKLPDFMKLGAQKTTEKSLFVKKPSKLSPLLTSKTILVTESTPKMDLFPQEWPPLNNTDKDKKFSLSIMTSDRL